jgi:Zn-dependent protease
MAIATVVGVAVSIVLHELGHTLVGRLFGVRVRSITLFVFGGVASMENEPKNARGEFFMALMGPVVSAALSAGFLSLSVALKASVSTETYGVLRYLGMLNGALAVFNLAPAFPLDGGRLLRALIWGRTGDPLQATRIAAGVGEGVAWLMMGLGLVAALGGGVTGGLWWMLLGFFILTMARAHRTQAESNALLSGLRVADVMTPGPVTAPGGLSVEEFVQDCLVRAPHDLIPVMDGALVTGGAGFNEVRKVARKDWPQTRLADIQTPLRDIPTAAPDDDISQALMRLQGRGASRLLVLSGDRLVGILTLKDVFTRMRLRAALASP